MGWLPIARASAQARFLAHLAVITAVVLSLMLLTLPGLMRDPATAGAIRVTMTAVALAVLGAGWLIEKRGTFGGRAHLSGTDSRAPPLLPA